MDKKHILSQIKNGEALTLTFPVINESIQETMHFIVDSLLVHYGQEEKKELLYSSLKELVINGIKANLKHHMVEIYSLDETNPQIQEMLKELLNEKELKKFEEIARRRDFNVKITIQHSSDEVILLVENNTVITKNEFKRVQDKFERALQYNNLFEYYMEHGDETEGSGLGITMIVLMLKGEGIDPKVFSIERDENDVTIAKLHVPLRSGE